MGQRTHTLPCTPPTPGSLPVPPIGRQAHLSAASVSTRCCCCWWVPAAAAFPAAPPPPPPPGGRKPGVSAACFSTARHRLAAAASLPVNGSAGAGRACGRAKQPRASVRSIHLSLPLQATIELADYVADRQRLGLADLPHNFGVRRRQAATNESHDGSPHTPPVDASETCKSWVIANVPFDIRGWSVIIFGFDRHVNAS